MRIIKSLLYRIDTLRGRVEQLRARATVRRFHILYYFNKPRTWANTRFLGVEVWKCPLDLWVYQEIIFETRPDVLVETGTARGGSAFYFARLFDLLGAGCVISVDIERRYTLLDHPRITYVTGSSVAPETLAAVRSKIMEGKRVMVALDSDHSCEHVIKELEAYSQLVTPGCYLVVEDSCVNGHPVFRGHGPGPAEALREFLKSNKDFTVDRSREKFFLTFNPGGYLRRRP
jgi:cephalosporin hydroxylase